MIVVAQRNVLDARLAIVQLALAVLVEPGLVPATQVVDARGRLVDHLASHHDELGGRECERLDKAGGGLASSSELGEVSHASRPIPMRRVRHLHVLLARHHANFDGQQHA